MSVTYINLYKLPHSCRPVWTGCLELTKEKGLKKGEEGKQPFLHLNSFVFTDEMHYQKLGNNKRINKKKSSVSIQ